MESNEALEPAGLTAPAWALLHPTARVLAGTLPGDQCVPLPWPGALPGAALEPAVCAADPRGPAKSDVPPDDFLLFLAHDGYSNLPCSFFT